MQRALVTLSALVLLTGTGRADESFPSPSLYVGVFGGANLVLSDWDLHSEADYGASPASSAMGGLRVGAQLIPWLAAEVSLAFIPLSANDPVDPALKLSGLGLHYGATLLFTPFEGAWTPHALVGGGVYQLAGGDFGSDMDWEIHAGLGLRGLLTDWLALRVEARYHLTDGFPDRFASLVDATVGVDFIPWRVTGPPGDRDGDGVPDDVDACPAEPGVSRPELLADGVGLGCPDTDGDGVIDRDDRCMFDPGPARHRGCPDSDGDGIPDIDDRCPDKPGLREHDGCPPPLPDADGDGIPDEIDGCPDEPGPASTEGCPDADGDGVPDLFDMCPDAPGVPEEDGCMPAVVTRKFTGTIPGIQFETGSAAIRTTSHRVLDEAVAIFTKYPTLKVEISGHTDNQGDAAFNLRLSQERADAVRTYLTDRGVEGRRVTAMGYGQEQPVADNATSAGRTKNRRIEFRIMATP